MTSDEDNAVDGDLAAVCEHVAVTSDEANAVDGDLAAVCYASQ